MKVRWLLVLLFVGMLVGGIVGRVDKNNDLPYMYSGDLTFQSEREYVQFKEYVTRPDVRITDIAVLASDPPIWVRYSVVVDQDAVFPYEYDSRGRYSGGDFGTMFPLACLIVLGIIGTLFSIPYATNRST